MKFGLLDLISKLLDLCALGGELLFDVLLLAYLLAILFQLRLQVINLTHKLRFLIIRHRLILLLHQHLLLLLQQRYLLMILLLHLRDQLVLHIYLFLCHLLEIELFLFDVLLDLVQLGCCGGLDQVEGLLVGEELLVALEELLLELLGAGLLGRWQEGGC